jgi:hypothetical protein
VFPLRARIMPRNESPENPNPNQAQTTYVRQQIPTFTGDTDIVDWLRSYGKWADQGNLDNDQKLRAVEAALSGKAKDWYGYMDRDGKLETWDNFRTCIEARFKQKTSAQDMCKALTDLKQRQDETVRDFTDRVNRVALMFKEECQLPAHNTPEGRRLKEGARDAVLELIKRTLFVTGLKENLRVDVLKQSIDSWEETLRAAERVESAENPKKSPQGGRSINAMEDANQMDNGQGEAAAFSDQRGRGRGRGNRGRGRGGRREEYNGRPSWLRDNMLPPNTCYRCGHQGHRRADCVTKPENFYWQTLAQRTPPQPLAAMAPPGMFMPMMGQWPQQAPQANHSVQEQQHTGQQAWPALQFQPPPAQEEKSSSMRADGAPTMFRYADF